MERLSVDARHVPSKKLAAVCVSFGISAFSTSDAPLKRAIPETQPISVVRMNLSTTSQVKIVAARRDDETEYD